MKKSIRNVLCFSMIVFCMFIGGMVINVDAEETSTISDTGYTVTIPSEVSIDSSTGKGSLDVKASGFTDFYSDLNVTATSSNNYKMKDESGKYSIDYTIDNSSLSYTEDGSKSYTLTATDLSNASVSGTYTDTLTFSVIGTKKKYRLDLNGTLDGIENDNGDFGDYTSAKVTIDGVEKATSAISWYDLYDAGTSFKFEVTYDQTKYELSSVGDGKDENGNYRNAENYGMTVNIDNVNGKATVSGVISGQNALTNYGTSIYDTRVDFHFTTKTYNLTLDYYKLNYEGTTTYTDEENVERHIRTINNVKYGSDISDYLPNDLIADQDANIVFLGWHTIDQPSSGWQNLESLKRASKTMPASDTTLYTWWTKTIYLDLNGEISGEGMVDEGKLTGFATADISVNGETKETGVVDSYLECEYGDTYKITPHAESGFTYVGIAENKYPGKLTNVPGLESTINRDDAVNLYFFESTEKANEWAVKVNLVFRRNTFTVQFNSNGGEGTMSNQSFSYGKTQKLTKCTFTNTGYKFTGWSTSKDGSDTITDESDGSTLTTTDCGTVTLYAKWEADTSSTDTQSSEDEIAVMSLDDESFNVLQKSDDVDLTGLDTDSTNEVMLDADEIVEDVSEVEQTEN